MPTSTTTLTQSDLDTIIKHARMFGLTVTPYSGRFMYGEYCLGIEGRTPELLSLIFSLTDEHRKIARMLAWDATVAEDQMGFDTIFYWPLIALPEGALICTNCDNAVESKHGLDKDGICQSCDQNRWE